MREQALRFGDCIDVAEARLVARRGLLRGGARGGHLHRRIRGDAARALEGRDGGVPLRAQVHRDLLRAGGLRADRRRLRGFPRAGATRSRRPGNVTLKPERVVLHAGREAIDAAENVRRWSRRRCRGRRPMPCR